MAVDVDMNLILDLAEYKEFCRRQVANISKRVGICMKTVSEDHMYIAWKINQFSGQGGITRADFKQKALIDACLIEEA
jgi:hypothetical protein